MTAHNNRLSCLNWDELHQHRNNGRANAFFIQALSELDSGTPSNIRQDIQRAQAVALEHIGDAARDSGAWAQSELAYVQARGTLERLGMRRTKQANSWQISVW